MKRERAERVRADVRGEIYGMAAWLAEGSAEVEAVVRVEDGAVGVRRGKGPVDGYRVVYRPAVGREIIMYVARVEIGGFVLAARVPGGMRYEIASAIVADALREAVARARN